MEWYGNDDQASQHLLTLGGVTDDTMIFSNE